MFSGKTVAATVAVTLLGAGLVALAPAAPALAASCYDTSCLGLNPIDAGCNANPVPVTTQSVYADPSQHIKEVDLRYSATCDAYWARIDESSNPDPGLIEVIGRTCTGEPTDRICHPVVNESSWDAASGSSVFTLMIPGDYWARACWEDNGNSLAWTCTP